MSRGRRRERGGKKRRQRRRRKSGRRRRVSAMCPEKLNLEKKVAAERVLVD